MHYNESTLPERRLMQAVILTAIADACGQSSDTCHARLTEYNQRRAKLWFADAGSDFQGVCNLAGLHPDTVRKFALAFIESGKPFPRTRPTHIRGPRSPVSPSVIAVCAGISVSAVRGVLKYDSGSTAMKELVRRTLQSIVEEQSCAA